MKTLNQDLYNALMRAFNGEVRVSNEGQPFIARVSRDMSFKSGGRLTVEQRGEHYQVCCPFCGDRRFRLSINHRWDTEYNGNKLSHLIHCFHENCEEEITFYSEFKKRLQYVGSEAKVADVPAPQIELAKPMGLDGKFTLVNDLPTMHAAVRYLRHRNYDETELGKVWDISWCEYNSVLPHNNRLFFPIYDEVDGKKQLVGGQAHWMDLITLNGTPPKREGVKWYTLPGSKVSQVLYNGYRAYKQKDIVVITEGAFDAMRVGKDYGVALFGHNVSYRQKQLLWDHWGRHDGMAVLALDEDVYAGKDAKEVAEIEAWFKRWKYFRSLRMPKGVDIGDLTTADAWDMINKELAK